MVRIAQNWVTIRLAIDELIDSSFQLKSEWRSTFLSAAICMLDSFLVAIFSKQFVAVFVLVYSFICICCVVRSE